MQTRADLFPLLTPSSASSGVAQPCVVVKRRPQTLMPPASAEKRPFDPNTDGWDITDLLEAQRQTVSEMQFQRAYPVTDEIPEEREEVDFLDVMEQALGSEQGLVVLGPGSSPAFHRWLQHFIGKREHDAFSAPTTDGMAVLIDPSDGHKKADVVG